MKIQLSDNIYWDTQETILSEEANAWIQENVLQKLGVDETEGFITPKKDRFGRPIKWEYKGDTCRVIVEREYVFPNTGKWSKKCDKISVYE